MRERCNVVKEKAFRNELNHFDVDMSKFDDTASFVVGLIKVRTLTLTLKLLVFTFGENLIQSCNIYLTYGGNQRPRSSSKRDRHRSKS